MSTSGNSSNQTNHCEPGVKRQSGTLPFTDGIEDELKTMKLKQLIPLTNSICFGGALAAGIGTAKADDASMQELKARVALLEDLAKKEGILPSGTTPPKMVSALSDINLSGFVTASYFYDTSQPPGNKSPGYLWNRQSDSFDINKIKLTIASTPVEQSGEKFGAAFRASFIWGQDAPIVNSGAGANPGFNNLREAYVELNVPVGSGINVKAGELISLLNYESGDGGAANDNFSQGYQWFYTGNGPAAGVQAGYSFTDKVDLKVRVQNGLYAGPVDSDGSKTFMGALGVKPCKDVWLSFIGFFGRENPNLYLDGASLLGGWKATDKFNIGTELDYFNFHVGSSDHLVYSAGGWFAYTLTDKVTAALRAEFLSDHDGVDASGDPLGFALNGGQDIYSFAFTLNYKPVANIKLQPEIRFDHTTLSNGFGKEDSRVLVGMGASYLF